MFREGQQIGNYILIKRIGRGGFGEVWLAERRTALVTKKVAVKLPHDEQIDFETVRHEAAVWEQASGHPNVLPIIDADVYDGQVVIVSEYASGGSLFDKLKAQGKLPTKQAVEMTIGILNGLDFLHHKKIIHRDIKPQNILLQGNTPRLADFGISRAMTTASVSSTVSGTDAYMSPEAFDGKRNVQTDIWSVGVVLYQLLKGSLPFPQAHPTERLFAILQKEFEPLPNEFPVDLRRIVQKALAKDINLRYQTAEEICVDLQQVLLKITYPIYASIETENSGKAAASTKAISPNNITPITNLESNKNLPTAVQTFAKSPRQSNVNLIGFISAFILAIGLLLFIGGGTGLLVYNKIIHSTPTPTPTPTPTLSPVFPSPKLSPSPLLSPSPQNSNSLKIAQMPPPRSDKMYIAYSSSSDDFIGQGNDKVFTSNGGDFTSKITGGVLSIRFKSRDVLGESWGLELAAPGNIKLAPGSYENVERCAFHEKTRPGLEFTGSGRGCNKIGGSFNIENIIYSADESNILYLDATFIQQCEVTKPPLMGRVHYDVKP